MAILSQGGFYECVTCGGIIAAGPVETTIHFDDTIPRCPAHPGPQMKYLGTKKVVPHEQAAPAIQAAALKIGESLAPKETPSVPSSDDPEPPASVSASLPSPSDDLGGGAAAIPPQPVKRGPGRPRKHPLVT